MSVLRATFKRVWSADIRNLLVLAAIGLSTSLFLVRGHFLLTGYSDWLYNAARTRFLELHGITSWDHVWASGMSYWRGFQLLPSYLTLWTSQILDADIPKTMVLFVVAFVVLYRVGIYAAARYFGAGPASALVATVITFTYAGFWNVVKDFNIAFAAVAAALSLMLWKKSLNSLSAAIIHAFVIGLSVYIHPLLAFSLGLLWLMSIPWMVRRYRWSLLFLQGIIMAICSWFYVYGLLFLDAASSSAYQRTQDFILTIGAEVTKIGPLYYIAFAFCWGMIVLFGKQISSASKILLLVSTTLFIAIELNMSTRALAFLNPLQIVRSTFFVITSMSIVLAECLEVVFRAAFFKKKQWVQFGIVVFLVVYSALYGLYNATVHAPIPVENIADPVHTVTGLYGKPEGRVYIADSMISSYNFPQYQFVVGYNEHLLPSQLGVRLRDLLTTPLGYKPTEREVLLVRHYAYLLGVSDLYLKSDSPFINALTDTTGVGTAPFTIKATVASNDGTLVVLTPPGTPLQAVAIPASARNELTACTSEDGQALPFRELDACVQSIVPILQQSDATPLTVNYSDGPTTLAIEAAPLDTVVYLSENYSSHWSVLGGTIERHPLGTSIIQPTSSTTINLTHQWPIAMRAWPAIMLLLAISVIAASRIVPSRSLLKEAL